MVEALLVFVVIILAMALTAGYFYFKQKIQKLEDDIKQLDIAVDFNSRGITAESLERARTIINENTPMPQPVEENDIEKTDPESIDITPDNLHSIVTNKNIKIVTEDVFSDEDNMVM